MLDLIGVIIVALYFFRGWKKGIIVAVCSMAAIVIGVMAALKLSHSLAAFFAAQGWVASAWAQIVAYAVLFIGVIWIVRLIAKSVEGVLKTVKLGFLNSLAGGVLYALVGAFIWSVALWIGARAHIISEESIGASKTFAIFEPVAPWVFAHIGAVLPFARELLGDLGRFFDSVNNRIPGRVGTH